MTRKHLAVKSRTPLRRITGAGLDLMSVFSRFLVVVFMAGGGYLFAVNLNAVQGYQIRALEKEIVKLKVENAELKIAEADLRSLYRIEATGEALLMQKTEEVRYLEEPGAVALR